MYKGSFKGFSKWMRNHNYPESIIDIYRCNYRDPALKLIMDEYFRIRKGDLKWPSYSLEGYRKFRELDRLHLNFIEVVPTDEGIKFNEVDPGVLNKFNNYLIKRFGKNIIIKHRKIKLNHNKKFGDIFYSYSTLFRPEINPKLDSFIKQFDPPCIVKFDLEFINGKEVVDIWNIRHCAIIMGKNFKLIDDVDIFDKYAHEFGHNIGLVHQFIDPDNPVRGTVSINTLYENKGRHVGLDDIMIKSKEPENEKIGHYLSPLSRYVLEPRKGYEDNDELGLVYSDLYSKDTIERIKKSACQL
ncbi:MAG: hypothetical protein K9L61_00260 [Candidatus Omnitrophica bacterium]|nr:hypothetical protein [Candidatus Omnitrophota bacterium]